jgi:hypothetical protein
MKAIFLVDSIPNVDMFVPIIKELPIDCDSRVINLDRWAKQNEIEQKLQKYGIQYMTIGGWKRKDVNEVLVDTKPSVVVMSHDATIPVDPLFIKCANAKGIPILYVPHGMISSASWVGLNDKGFRNWLLYLKMAVLGFGRLMKSGKVSQKRIIEIGWMWVRHIFRHKMEAHGGWTKAAVFGDDAKHRLISIGVKPNNIVVTGNPKFDYVYYSNWSVRGKGMSLFPAWCECQLSKFAKQDIYQRLHITDDGDIVLLLTDYLVECGQWTAKQRVVFVKAVCETVSKLPKAKLVIKLHPVAERIIDYQDIVWNSDYPAIVCQNEPLWELLRACKVAITVVSGAGLEVMAAGKPLIILNLFGDESPFGEADGAYMMTHKDDLLPALKAIMSYGLPRDRKITMGRFVYNHAYLQDGKAAKRIADLIVEMGKKRIVL